MLASTDQLEDVPAMASLNGGPPDGKGELLDNGPRPVSRFWAWLGVGFCVFTLLGLFDASNMYLRYAYEGKHVTWAQTLAMGLLFWYQWAILSLFVFELARRFPIEQKVWPRSLAVHLVAGATFALLKLVMDYPIIYYFYCPTPWLLTFPVFFKMAFTDMFGAYVLRYWAILGVAHAINYYQMYRKRELCSSQLEARLALAQLQLLKMELHPHFLFNTLHSISALIHSDAERADRMLTRLGDLLRLTLENSGTHEVCLSQELDFIQTYLEIEQVRFGSRLAIQRQIDPEVLGARVPYLILQPLVENAIRHGIAPYPRPGQVGIGARRVGTMLWLQVWDTGPGLTEGWCNGRCKSGIGLTNTRSRLRQLYGEGHAFQLRNANTGGLVVTIELPYRPGKRTRRAEEAG
jgi:signal transduction histidine kinase